MSTSKLVEDAIVEAVANKIWERLQKEFQGIWATLTVDTFNNGKAIEALTAHINSLENYINRQNQGIANLQEERQIMRETAQKALDLLKDAKEELGLQ